MDLERMLNELAGQRADQLAAAENALAGNDQPAYDAAMAEVSDLDTRIARVNALIAAKAKPAAPAIIRTTTEAEDLATERMQDLQGGKEVTFSVEEVRNAITLATGNIVEPAQAGSNIRDRLSPVSSIIDQVSVVDLTGTGGIEEPYVKAEQAAQAGTVEAQAGTARTATDPTMRKAAIKPYEVNVTTYVDRNLVRLSPAKYMEKIQSMAMTAMRRKVAALILNGDGQATPAMYGIKSAKNTDAEAMFASLAIVANGIDVTTLQALYVALGTDNELAGDARLYLNKADLAAFGNLRGTNEKKRLIEITPEPGNPNCGTLVDGGVIVPYTISSDLTAVTGATAGANAIQTLCYGNPLAYELGLFGGYTIRVDESYKAGERLLTILGDVMVGGNLVVDNSFVIATIAKA